MIMSQEEAKEALARFMEVFGPLFPADEWEEPRLRPLLGTLRFRDMEAGTIVLREGQACSSVPFVTDGVIRLFKSAESGRSITLYRIAPGETCILSTGCGRELQAFPATVLVEEKARAAFMPIDTFRALFAKGAAFRDFVLSQYASRMAEVMELVEEVAFRRVDERLGQWLLDSAAARPGRSVAASVNATHQELADHLGTSREVVSRILKDWELRGMLELSRGSVALLPGFEEAFRGGRQP